LDDIVLKEKMSVDQVTAKAFCLEREASDGLRFTPF